MARRRAWKNDLSKFVRKIEVSLGKAMGANPMKALGREAVRLIVKRTRLGYGVDRDLGAKSRLKPLSARYVDWRQKNKRQLSGFTTPRRSNLTKTGQMLDSMTILETSKGRVVIGPSGARKGSRLSNQKVAEFVTKQGRPFNYLSELEFNQLVRYYRRTFGDLVRNQRLTFRPDQ